MCPDAEEVTEYCFIILVFGDMREEIRAGQLMPEFQQQVAIFLDVVALIEPFRNLRILLDLFLIPCLSFEVAILVWLFLWKLRGFPSSKDFSRQGLVYSPKHINRLTNEVYAMLIRESRRQTIAVCIEVPHY